MKREALLGKLMWRRGRNGDLSDVCVWKVEEEQYKQCVKVEEEEVSGECVWKVKEECGNVE